MGKTTAGFARSIPFCNRAHAAINGWFKENLAFLQSSEDCLFRAARAV
jgi:hypothetical protein